MQILGVTTVQNTVAAAVSLLVVLARDWPRLPLRPTPTASAGEQTRYEHAGKSHATLPHHSRAISAQRVAKLGTKLIP